MTIHCLACGTWHEDSIHSGLPYAHRVMRARHPGTCRLGGDPIGVGDQICLVHRDWSHTSCLIELRQRTQPRPEPDREEPF